MEGTCNEFNVDATMFPFLKMRSGFHVALSGNAIADSLRRLLTSFSVCGMQILERDSLFVDRS